MRSQERHYWRAAVLDRFDGYVWERSRTDVGQRPLELPTVVDRRSAAGAPEQLNPDWLVRTEFTLRELQSEVAIAPGALDPPTASRSTPTPNGTAFVEDGALGEGDVYTAVSYAPQSHRGRDASRAGRLRTGPRPHTAIRLPETCRGARVRTAVPGAAARRRRRAQGRAAVRLSRSSYGEVFELARRLTAGAPTTYDAVKAIEIHLQSSYDYVEDVQLAALPYAPSCSMAGRLLRAVLRSDGADAACSVSRRGSPPGSARVAPMAGSLRGPRSRGPLLGGGLLHRDRMGSLRSHPGRRPAELQLGGGGAASAAGGEVVEARPRAAATPAPPRPAGPDSTGGVPPWPFALAIAPCHWPPGSRWRSSEAPSPIALRLGCRRGGTEELAAALERLGWPIRPRFTLSRVEDVMRAARCPSAAAYVASLRAVRFGRGRPTPSLSERRRVRRELRRFPGWRATLDSYLAIPPGAPRRGSRI